MQGSLHTRALLLYAVFDMAFGEWKSHVHDNWWQTKFHQEGMGGIDAFFTPEVVGAILHPDQYHWSVLNYSRVEPITNRDNREGWSTWGHANPNARRIDLKSREAVRHFHVTGGVLRVENVESLMEMRGLRVAILGAFGRKCVVGCMHLYYATAGKGSYGWHVDEVDVFVYGIAGQKRLRVAGIEPR